MDTRTLINMVNTRIEANDGNPTSRSFFYEIIKALEELEQYRSGAVGTCGGTSSCACAEDSCYIPLGKA